MTTSKRERLEATAGATSAAVRKAAARVAELTVRRDQAIVALRADGASLPAIAKACDLSITSIVKSLARAEKAPSDTPE